MNISYSILVSLLALGFAHGTPTLPSQDPFYRLPEGYETKPLGAILDYRRSPYPLKMPLPMFVGEGYQILFRTSDSLGRPTAAVMTLLIPPNPDFDKIMVNTPVSNSPCLDCCPSYTSAEGAKSNEFDDRMNIAHYALWSAGLNQGWIVALPDYEGLNAAYLANRRAAYAALDSIRATKVFTNASTDAAAVIVGYSGGSVPVVLAGELQEAYAPELNVVGIATGGLFPDLWVTIWRLFPVSGLIPMALWGLANEYPEIDHMITENLTDDPQNRTEFQNLRNTCFGAIPEKFTKEPIACYFKSLDFINSSTTRQILADNSLGQGTPKAPVLIYESTHDYITTAEDIDAVVNRYCDAGVRVDYRRVQIESHGVLGADIPFPELVWAKQRFDGVPMPERCQRSTRPTAMDLDAVAFLPNSLVGILRRILPYTIPGV